MNAAQPSRRPGGAPPGEEAMPQARQAVTALYQAHALAPTTGSRVAVISGNHVTPLSRPASVLSGNADAGVW
jgi:hypothetical protein